MTNIFAPKKKEPLLYTPANQNMSMARTQPQQKTNPITQWGNQAFSGNGSQATQSMFSSTLPKAPQVVQKQPQQNMSMAPKVIQGSGYGSNYASNPSNYKAPTPPPPVVQKPPQPQQNPQMQTIDSFLKGQQGIADQKKQLAGQQLEAGNEFRTGMYNMQQNQLSGMKGSAQESFDNFERGTLAGLDRVRGAGERNKENVDEYYGDAQRTAAQARRETQGDASRRFASLNTIDSFGEGSFKQANENIDSDFNRLTQSFAREKAGKLADIDDQVFGAEQTAEQSINQERLNLKQVLQQIDSTMQAGTMEHKFAQEQAFAAYQDSILGIEDWFNNIKYTGDQQKMALQLELDAMNSLSPEFLTAFGGGLSQQEFDYVVKNMDFFKEAYPDMFGGDQTMAATAEKQDLISLVDKALKTELGPMTGAWGASGLLTKWGEGLETKALIDQIKNKLTVDAREKLKGQGQISDSETAMLANSVSKLQQGMTAAGLKSELEEIRNILSGQYRYAEEQSGNSQNDPLSLGF